MWKYWYIDVIGLIIGGILVLFNLNFVWFAIVLIVASIIGSMMDHTQTEIRIDRLEERIRDLESK